MNARVFDRSGAAIIVEQQSDRSMIRRLNESLEELLQDDTRLNSMRLAMGSLACPDATQRVADCLDRLIQQKNATTSSIQEPTRNMQSRVA
jgi:UDP-N-acetylglucosamine:LPS N-acetylglucosamine transferase